ncbi:Biopolymer transport protein exbD [Kingella potus]|uniref:Biopolymer transport protein exbD n=1 Tax=Kingella potus TaxID=265175 RepID=A0A377R6T9_9NEIS|nr:biopolymer transporter ExbD [Kingella potus]UOO99996.1 biopolymer transporter ExbD [Kingella potus]STR03285.1 Biopolymer transport protein exbD [Kingella potus]
MSFSMNEGGDDAPVSDINVTPLVDVILVLLIVFMITMPVLTHSIQIQLPTASETAGAQEETKPKDPMWLSIDESGQYFINRTDTPIAKENLSSAFAQAVADNPEVILAVDASKDVDYGTVIQAIDMAKEAKIKKIGFNTEVKNVASPQ